MSSEKTPQLGRTTPAYVQPSKKLQQQYLFLTFCFSIIFKMKVCPWMPPPPAHTQPLSPALPSRIITEPPTSVGAVPGVGCGQAHTVLSPPHPSSAMRALGPSQRRPHVAGGSSPNGPPGRGSGAPTHSQPPAPGIVPPRDPRPLPTRGVLTDGRPPGAQGEPRQPTAIPGGPAAHPLSSPTGLCPCPTQALALRTAACLPAQVQEIPQRSLWPLLPAHGLLGGSGQTNQLPCPSLKGRFVGDARWGLLVPPVRLLALPLLRDPGAGDSLRQEWEGSPKPADTNATPKATPGAVL